jgi:hypothetical protein
MALAQSPRVQPRTRAAIRPWRFSHLLSGSKLALKRDGCGMTVPDIVDIDHPARR